MAALWAAQSPAGPERDERRNGRRRRVLDTAKIIFAGCTLDCLVMDVSQCGVNVKIGTFVPLPERVRIRFRDGREVFASRRWVRGLEVGFLLDETSGPAAAPA